MNLFLLRGIPGAGKSTLAHYLTERFDAIAVAADDFMVNNQGEYSFDLNRLAECHDKCRLKVEAAMQIQITNIIVHNTLTTMREMKPYLRLAEQYGYRVYSLIVENRHGNLDVHSVPEETRQKMKARFDVCL